ncbi:MAG TPA: acetolactate synthase small subunit [Thermomicrobiales bacterium]|nr:acetolactate synthase small subunit [Thermomicrobiales bacterium]
MKQTHTLVVLVEDQPGVLNRVVSLMRRRNFNIDSIAVGHSEQPGQSRMTLMVTGEDAEVEQASKQLYKLLEVLKVTDLSANEAITREMVLVKVAAKGGQRAEIMQIAQVYNARILDATPGSLMIEATGTEDQIESFLGMMRIFGIREMVRGGKIAMARASASKSQGRIDRINDDNMAVAD